MSHQNQYIVQYSKALEKTTFMLLFEASYKVPLKKIRLVQTENKEQSGMILEFCENILKTVFMTFYSLLELFIFFPTRTGYSTHSEISTLFNAIVTLFFFLRPLRSNCGHFPSDYPC